MPVAVPAADAAHLPPARMIDPRGHRFGAGLSALLLIASFVTGFVPGVVLALLSSRWKWLYEPLLAFSIALLALCTVLFANAYQMT